MVNDNIDLNKNCTFGAKVLTLCKKIEKKVERNIYTMKYLRLFPKREGHYFNNQKITNTSYTLSITKREKNLPFTIVISVIQKRPMVYVPAIL